MLIPQTNTWEPGFRKKTIKQELKIGPVSLRFVTIALIAIGGLFYLAQSSQTSTEKYQIMQLTSDKAKAEAQSRDLEVEAARLKSLNEINTTSQALGLVSNQ